MTTFADIGVQGGVLKGLDELGFSTPTPVQEQLIPIALEKHIDLVGLAQTGTGKTAAFGVPLVQLTDSGSKKTQALVLCPTRELCVQVAGDIANFAKYVSDLKVLAVYGGEQIDRQINALKRGVQIIVATPGRLHDLIRRRKVDISAIRTVVLDEADEMLQMGFQDELNAILATTPDTKNTVLFSATMPKGVAALASTYMTDPLEITIGQRNAGAENIRHLYYTVHAKDRYRALKRIADINPQMYAIVFCRTRQETKDVADRLIQDGYSADAIHGDLSQSQRDHVMNKFRRKNLHMLVATDVAARGLDVDDLSHVINYNLPDEIGSYTHRSGRTGRAGKAGTSIVIIHMREKHKIREIERMLKRKFESCQVPSGHEICEKQLFSLIKKVKQIDVDHAKIDPFLPDIAQTLDSLDREELIKRFVLVEFNRFLEYYRNAPDLNASEGRGERQSGGSRKKHDSGGKRSDCAEFTRFFINVGKKDGMNPNRLIGQLNDATGTKSIRIGKINIKEDSALLEADSKFASQVLDAFQGQTINGKKVVVEVAGKKMARSSGDQPARQRPSSFKKKNFHSRDKGKRRSPSRKPKS